MYLCVFCVYACVCGGMCVCARARSCIPHNYLWFSFAMNFSLNIISGLFLTPQSDHRCPEYFPQPVFPVCPACITFSATNICDNLFAFKPDEGLKQLGAG